MKTPLSNRQPGHHTSLSGTKGKGPDRKKLLLIGVSIGLGIVILIALAAIAFTALGNKGPGNATPVPTVTPEPSEAPTVTPAPAPTLAPATEQAYSTDGPFLMSAFLKGSTGESRVMLKLSPGAAYVNVSKLTISILCDGKMYDNVWTIRPMDWAKADMSDNDSILEYDESIVADIDTAKLGIPQGKPLTIKVTRNGDLMQQVAVAPT
jgi:hypothetical protein